MTKLTAIIHTHNDARRLGRALESLRPCDELLVVDHGSTDDTEKVARSHGATFRTAVAGVADGAYAMEAKSEWVLCLRASEAISEALEASLLEWKQREHDQAACFSVPVRAEAEGRWQSCPPETRLVNRGRVNWTTELPPYDPGAPKLAGDLLRFRTP